MPWGQGDAMGTVPVAIRGSGMRKQAKDEMEAGEPKNMGKSER